MSRQRLMRVRLCCALWPAAVHAQHYTSDAVLVVNTSDVSGSMVRAVEAMAASDIERLRRTLKPGDAYARIEFAADARLTMLQEVRAVADVENIVAVLGQKAFARGQTSISRGLIAAREVAERFGTARRVVLVIATDGANDPPDGAAAEGRRLDTIAEWWRHRANADRILVGTGLRRQALEELAAQLGARLVSLDAYATTPVVERAIATARERAVVGTPPPVAAHRAERRSTRVGQRALMPGALAVVAVFGFLLIARRRRARHAAGKGGAASAAAVVAVPTRTQEELVVTVTANGQTEQTVLSVDDIESGILTLGGAGVVKIPGLPGAPLTVMLGSDGMSNAESPGTGALLNGQPLAQIPLPARVGRACRLAIKSVAMSVQLRPVGGHGAVQPDRPSQVDPARLDSVFRGNRLGKSLPEIRRTLRRSPQHRELIVARWDEWCEATRPAERVARIDHVISRVLLPSDELVPVCRAVKNAILRDSSVALFEVTQCRIHRASA